MQGNRIAGSMGGLFRDVPGDEYQQRGLAFLCSRRLREGDKVVVRLQIPDESAMDLRAVVMNQKLQKGGEPMATAIRFMPFGKRSRSNPTKNLDTLRKLDAKYGKDEP